MCKVVMTVLKKIFNFFIFFVCFCGGFAFCDFVSYRSLDFRYGHVLTQNEIAIVQKARNVEYNNGKLELFNWIPYKVVKAKGGYDVFFYPPNADGFSMKYFMFVFTNGACCGHKKVFFKEN